MLITSGVGSIPTHSRHFKIGMKVLYRYKYKLVYQLFLSLPVLLIIATNCNARNYKINLKLNIKYRCFLESEILLPVSVGESSVYSDTGLVRRRSSPDTATAIWGPERLKTLLQVQSLGLDSRTGKIKEEKNARLAMIYSLLFPGLGQLYNERPFKAALAMGIETFYLSQILLNYRYASREEKLRDRYPPESYEYYVHNVWVDEYKARAVDWIWWSGGAIFLIVVDAYVDAHLYDMNVDVNAGIRADRLECSLGFRF